MASAGLLWLSGLLYWGFPRASIDTVAKEFGIGYPPVLGLTLGIALLVIKVLFMDIERSRIEIRNQRLVQRVAMLEADLNKLKEDLALQ